MATLVIVSPLPNITINTIIQANFNLNLAYTVDDNYNASSLTYDIYYAGDTPPTSGSIPIIGINPDGGIVSELVPIPSKNSPNYGAVFGIVLTLTLTQLESIPDTPPEFTVTIDTGPGYRTLPTSWRPYVPKPYGTIQEAELEYWEGPGRSPVDYPVGQPPPDYPTVPWDSSTPTRPPGGDAI